METDRKEESAVKAVVIQPDDIIIQIDDLLARQFTIKQDKKEVKENG